MQLDSRLISAVASPWTLFNPVQETMPALFQPLRVAERILRAYDPRTEQGRAAWQALDAQGLEDLRSMARVPRLTQWLAYELPTGMVYAGVLAGVALLVWAVLVANQVLMGLGALTALGAMVYGARLERRVSNVVDELARLLDPLEAQVALRVRFRDATMRDAAAREYRDAVLARRELVFADLLVVEAFATN